MHRLYLAYHALPHEIAGYTQSKCYHATENDMYEGAPIITLCDTGTAIDMQGLSLPDSISSNKSYLSIKISSKVKRLQTILTSKVVPRQMPLQQVLKSWEGC